MSTDRRPTAAGYGGSAHDLTPAIEAAYGADAARACTEYLAARDAVDGGAWAALLGAVAAGREELGALRAELHATPGLLAAMRDDLAREIEAAADDPERLAWLGRVQEQLRLAAEGL